MNVKEAINILILYASNKSSCGKLLEKEYKASKIIKRFINVIENSEDIEIKKLLNERQ